MVLGCFVTTMIFEYELNSNFGEPYEVKTPLDDVLKNI